VTQFSSPTKEQSVPKTWTIFAKFSAKTLLDFAQILQDERPRKWLCSTVVFTQTLLRKARYFAKIMYPFDSRHIV
jgi:hypothetical protein